MILPILILSLILTYLIYNHYERFTINPTLFLKGNNTMALMREYRECRPNDVYCILSKKPFTYPSKFSLPTYSKYVNYKTTQNVKHLLPQKKPIRVYPNL